MEDKNKRKRLFDKVFFVKLREDKLYLLSFIITLVFVVISAILFLEHSEGIITKRKNANMKKVIKNVVSNDLLVYKYKVELNREIKVGTCDVSSYYFILQGKNNKYDRYFMNDCLGTKLLNKNITKVSIKGKELTYKNIAYTKDDKKVSETTTDIDIEVYNDNVILMSDDNLVLLENGNIKYISSDLYNNDGGNLEKRFYKSNRNYTYNFIIYSNGIEENCPIIEAAEEKKEDLVYTIYSVSYDINSNKFLDPLELVSRKNKDLCNHFNEDLELLKK